MIKMETQLANLAAWVQSTMTRQQKHQADPKSVTPSPVSDATAHAGICSVPGSESCWSADMQHLEIQCIVRNVCLFTRVCIDELVAVCADATFLIIVRGTF
jgi:hypothetical protein